jgi:hypothetical protein
LDLAQGFIDGTFVGAPKKGGRALGKTKRGKGTKLMAVADGAGILVAILATSASPYETTLVEATIEHRFAAAGPKLNSKTQSTTSLKTFVTVYRNTQIDGLSYLPTSMTSPLVG